MRVLDANFAPARTGQRAGVIEAIRVAIEQPSWSHNRERRPARGRAQ